MNFKIGMEETKPMSVTEGGPFIKHTRGGLDEGKIL